MNATVPSADRRGVFGTAQPSYQVSRFKRTINIHMNEEMAAEVQKILLKNEKSLEVVPPFLYEFLNQLDDAIKQQPPARGEKPRTRREAA